MDVYLDGDMLPISVDTTSESTAVIHPTKKKLRGAAHAAEVERPPDLLRFLTTTSGWVIYVDLNLPRLRRATLDLRRALIHAMPTEALICSARYNGHTRRVLTPIECSIPLWKALSALMKLAYWHSEPFRSLMRSLDTKYGFARHRYVFTGFLHIAPVARQYYETITDQNEHREYEERGVEITIALALGEYSLGTLFLSPRTGTYLSADTDIYAFDGYNWHKGPGHRLPIGAQLPYVGPRRAFAHFVSSSLSSKKIAYLQARDGMPIIAPRVLDLSM